MKLRIEFEPEASARASYLIFTAAQGSQDVGLKVHWRKIRNRHDVGGHGIIPIRELRQGHSEIETYLKSPPRGPWVTFPPFEQQLLFKSWFRLTHDIHGAIGAEVFHGWGYVLRLSFPYDDAVRLKARFEEVILFATGWPP